MDPKNWAQEYLGLRKTDTVSTPKGNHIDFKVMLRPEPCRRPTALQIVNASILKEDVHSYLTFTANLSNAQINSGSGEINPMAPEAETNCSSGSSAAGSIASI